ncbi:lytic transglycosylase domain-containing protein [Patescibacteria group bacterium]|nr:lytic transglycosylase domain-containing protein [Patescibacteria group bacterium]
MAGPEKHDESLKADGAVERAPGTAESRELEEASRERAEETRLEEQQTVESQKLTAEQEKKAAEAKMKSMSKLEREKLRMEVQAQQKASGDTSKEGFWELVVKFLRNLFGGRALDLSGGASTGGAVVTQEISREVQPRYTGAKEALKANPDWVKYAKTAERKFDIPSSVIFAIIEAESNFDAGAKNPLGSASGLGQFIDETWKKFLSENPEFLGKDQFDAEASINAVAWYARKNADAWGIDTKAPGAARELAYGHHEGTEGLGRLIAYREGRGDLKIPSAYRKKYPTQEAYLGFLNGYADSIAGKAASIEKLYEDGDLVA